MVTAAIQPGGADTDWEAAARAWAGADPAGFHDWLVRRGIPPGWTVLEILFSAWAKSDPETALRAAMNLPTDFDRGAALTYSLYSVLLKPEGLELTLKWGTAGVEQMESFGSPEGAPWLRGVPFEKTAAILAAHAGGQGLYLGPLLTQFGAKWAETDRSAALAWAHSLPPVSRASAFSGILDVWSKADPAGALAFLATQGTSSERTHAGAALKSLAEKHPEEALRWWETNLGTRRKETLQSIFSPWVKTGAEAAKAYAFGAEDPVMRQLCLSAWADSSPAAEVLSTLKTLPEGPDKTALIAPLVTAWRSREAVAFMRESVMAGSSSVSPYQAALFIRIQANRNPVAAFEWTAGIPEKYQAGALDEIMDSWDDATAASGAIEQLADGPYKDRARRALKESLANPDRGK